MLNLDNIYELLNNCIKIKEIFNNENFFREHIIELNNLLDNINNKNVKEILNAFYGIFYFNNNLFTLSENKFTSNINFIKDHEKKLQTKGKDEYEKLKGE